MIGPRARYSCHGASGWARSSCTTCSDVISVRFLANIARRAASSCTPTHNPGGLPIAPHTTAEVLPRPVVSAMALVMAPRRQRDDEFEAIVASSEQILVAKRRCRDSSNCVYSATPNGIHSIREAVGMGVEDRTF